MTREEAINIIQELMKACVPNSNYYIVGDMAIKALEQEPILDRISSEIESLIRGELTPLVNVYKVLDIIDKYKTESVTQ